jgi:cytochrome c-type biogenesis protein CcmH
MLSVLLVGALLCAATAFWVLRAYRRAGGGARSAFGALTACAIVGILTLGAYLLIGRPELGGAAYAQRLEELKQRDPTTYTADEALAILAEAARENPRDPLPHFYAGQLLLNQARPREAAREFDAALRREPRLAEAMVGLGRALVQIEGQVTQEAVDLFDTATTLTDDPAPWLYLAMHAAQQGDAANLRRYANEAASRMAPDDPRQEMVRELNRQGR